MKALIFVHFTKQVNFDFENKIFDDIRNAVSEVDVFDFDNHSAPEMVKYAISMIEKADKALVYFKMDNEEGSAKLIGLAEKLIKYSEKCFVILNGQNRLLEKMLSAGNKNILIDENTEAILEKVKSFLA